MDTDTSIKKTLKNAFPPPEWEDWLQAVKDTLKGADFDKAMKTKTYEGINLEPIYRKENLEKLAFLNASPGQRPFNRGNDPQIRIATGWRIAQAQDEPDPAKLNAILLDELYRGLDAINLKLKNADRTDGIRLESLEDLRAAFRDIDFKAAPLFLQLDLEDDHLLTLLEQYLQERSYKLSELDLYCGVDPSGELARKGGLPMELEGAWQRTLSLVNWALEKAPKCRVLSIDATIYEAAGASSVQELAFALSTAMGYIDGLAKAGLKIDQIAPLFMVRLSQGSNLFMEIAKIRAFRLLWSEMISNYGGSLESQKIWIHAKTASFNKSRYDIFNNVLRTSTECFSSVIGGADSIEVSCYDDLINPSSEFSRRIARNQQILMGEEAFLSKVIDPAGGSYYIESLTAELAEKAWKLMQEIETEGGFVKSLIAGKIHPRISEIATARIEAVNRRKDIFVGVNMYANALEKAHPDRKRYNMDLALTFKLGAGALPRLRAVEDIEKLRDKVIKAKEQRSMKVLLLNMGTIAEYKARADFATSFLSTGSLDLYGEDAFETVEQAINAAKMSDADAYCICSTDENYKSLVPQIGSALKGKPLILAGYPTDMVESYKYAGIDVFIHIRANLLQSLTDMIKLMGVE